MKLGPTLEFDHVQPAIRKRFTSAADIPKEVRPYLEDFAANRKAGENFTDFWGRTRVNGEAPCPEQFHVEFAERAAKKEAAAAVLVAAE